MRFRNRHLELMVILMLLTTKDISNTLIDSSKVKKLGGPILM